MAESFTNDKKLITDPSKNSFGHFPRSPISVKSKTGVLLREDSPKSILSKHPEHIKSIGGGGGMYMHKPGKLQGIYAPNVAETL